MHEAGAEASVLPVADVQPELGGRQIKVGAPACTNELHIETCQSMRRTKLKVSVRCDLHSRNVLT
jgi:hypothetical protein